MAGRARAPGENAGSIVFTICRVFSFHGRRLVSWSGAYPSVLSLISLKMIEPYLVSREIEKNRACCLPSPLINWPVKRLPVEDTHVLSTSCNAHSITSSTILRESGTYWLLLVTNLVLIPKETMNTIRFTKRAILSRTRGVIMLYQMRFGVERLGNTTTTRKRRMQST